jgi:hypothetical protein
MTLLSRTLRCLGGGSSHKKIELTKNEREEQRDSCADTVTGVGAHIIRTKMIIKQWIGMIISKFSLS